MFPSYLLLDPPVLVEYLHSFFRYQVRAWCETFGFEKPSVNTLTQSQTLSQSDDNVDQRVNELLDSISKRKNTYEKKLRQIRSSHAAELKKVMAESEERQTQLGGILNRMKELLAEKTQTISLLQNELAAATARNKILEEQLEDSKVKAVHLGVTCADAFEGLNENMQILIAVLGGEMPQSMDEDSS